MKRIFATKSLYNGNLGGLIGADQKCNTAAQAANLGGTWKAWLSDATTDAIDRISDVGPWYRVSPSIHKTKVFNNKANLTTVPLAAILVNEEGAEDALRNIWTGTKLGGTKSTVHCVSWTTSASTSTGQEGSVDSTSNGWTEDSLFLNECNNVRAIYCLEQ